jgi:hypothetical protein
LLRWVSPRTIKETFVSPTDYRYPFLEKDRWGLETTFEVSKNLEGFFSIFLEDFKSFEVWKKTSKDLTTFEVSKNLEGFLVSSLKNQNPSRSEKDLKGCLSF